MDILRYIEKLFDTIIFSRPLSKVSVTPKHLSQPANIHPLPKIGTKKLLKLTCPAVKMRTCVLIDGENFFSWS